ncbi:hypothetical protein BJF78_10035 [Pseudonocardia sp. CNS-139]|nr:hypothetical protein BJF78_10035 [Pseudonocardia sp. CNS-139]
MMSDTSADVLIASAAPDVRELANRTRELVRSALPDDVVETVDGNDIGFGWSTGYTGLICVISVYSRWVNLGVVDGIDLPDPQRLLQGSGRRHRYVRITRPSDLDQPGLLELLAAASARASRPRADR